MQNNSSTLNGNGSNENNDTDDLAIDPHYCRLRMDHRTTGNVAQPACCSTSVMQQSGKEGRGEAKETTVVGIKTAST